VILKNGILFSPVIKRARYAPHDYNVSTAA